MNDNATPFPADRYESQIQNMMPYYDQFHQATFDIVKTIHDNPSRWLDTGCGTGKFALKAASIFKDTDFFLADPSGRMLEILRQNLGIRDSLSQKESALLDFPNDYFDVITAILSHHYSDQNARRAATQNCFRMLKPGGIYVTFENIHPLSPGGTEILMHHWMNFKISQGEPPENENIHNERLGKEYFPIPIFDHVELLKNCGFKTVELLWASYMQAGFFAIK